MDDLATVLEEAGGLDAPRERAARLRALLAAELERGRRELSRPRSGYEAPVTVAVAPTEAGSGRTADTAGDGVVAVVPVDPTLRADPDAVPERGWLLVAALVGALVEGAGGGEQQVGAWGDALAVHVRADPADAPLVTLAFEEHVRSVDRLRARALAVPGFVLADATGFAEPIGPAHPLRVAAHVARLGGRPADQASIADHEEAVLALLEAEAPAIARPHEDPDPARRVARRILQRLHGMGKWGGYHTEFTHLGRGFAGNEKALAEEVGERLLAAGLLAEKPSVGQRHVFLDPRRAREIHALIERGELPAGLALPRED
jgi:hypothetical protein